MHIKLAVLSASALLLGACGGGNALYTWGSYPGALLSYSKNPDQAAKFSAAIEGTLRKAEAKRKVPPGLYAEYGYMLLDKGERDGAIIYFAKERDLWPESRVLMTKVITRLSAPRSDGASGDAVDEPSKGETK